MDTENRKPKTENRPFNRPLTPVVLALMAGIAAPAWGLNLPERWLPAVLLLLWLTLGAVWLARRPARLLPLVFFWLLGVAFYQQALHPPCPPHHLVNLPQGKEIAILGRLNRPTRLGQERVQLFLAAQAWLSPEGWRPATGNLLVAAPNLAPPPVGADLVVHGRLRPPRSLQNPGTFDRPRFLAADGIFRELRLKDRTDLVFLADSAGYPLGEKLRGGIRQVLKGLDPTLRAIYLSMLLGDQGEVTPEMRHHLARTGTSHLLVVNGLHLAMVAAVIFFLSSWLMRRSAWLLLRINAVKVATLLAAAAVVGYAWVAGGSPSTQRAEVMVLAYLLLVFLGRPREVWSALALAALIILSFTPLRLFSISMQLSFAAVAGLIYLMPRLLKMSGAFDQEFRPGLAKRSYVLVKEWAAASAVATLATAPLVAAYFQVVSLLGIVVNLVAIPLVLGLSLPLGEAAVFAQAIHLTPVAQGLLSLGQWPLWLGWQAITLGAGVPGSAIIVSIPTWLQIALYFLVLVLVLAPRGNAWTWGGAGLAGAALIVSVAAPMIAAPRTLEVTCLDTYGDLSSAVVSPEGRRLVVSAPRRSWPGRHGGGPGVLPAYCHWRQWRTLDQVLALSLSLENAGELLTLAQQFTVAGYWYGNRGQPGPALWDLWNYLGDRGRLPLPLEPWRRGPQPPASLGSAGLEYLKLGQDQGFALQVTGPGRRVLILPPGRDLELPQKFKPSETGLDLLVLPAALAGSPDGLPPFLARLQPRRLIVYGGDPGATGPGTGIPCHFTRNGAVSVSLGADGVTVRQWGQ